MVLGTALFDKPAFKNLVSALLPHPALPIATPALKMRCMASQCNALPLQSNAWPFQCDTWPLCLPWEESTTLAPSKAPSFHNGPSSSREHQQCAMTCSEGPTSLWMCACYVVDEGQSVLHGMIVPLCSWYTAAYTSLASCMEVCLSAIVGGCAAHPALSACDASQWCVSTNCIHRFSQV